LAAKKKKKSEAPTRRRDVEIVKQPLPVKVGGTVSSADLGGSSKYSNENFED
jgi:hypothetical protein